MALCSQDSLVADGINLGDVSVVVADVDVDFGDIGGGIWDICVGVGTAVSDGSMIFLIFVLDAEPLEPLFFLFHELQIIKNCVLTLVSRWCDTMLYCCSHCWHYTCHSLTGQRSARLATSFDSFEFWWRGWRRWAPTRLHELPVVGCLGHLTIRLHVAPLFLHLLHGPYDINSCGVNAPCNILPDSVFPGSCNSAWEGAK